MKTVLKGIAAMFVLAVLALAGIIVAAMIFAPQKTAPAPGVHAFTPPANRPDTKPTVKLDEPLVATLDISIEDSSRPRVFGTTNLPPGTELGIEITGLTGFRPSYHSTMKKVKVNSQNAFTSERFSENGEDLRPGTYWASVYSFADNDFDENLTGPLVQLLFAGDKGVKATRTFKLGTLIEVERTIRDIAPSSIISGAEVLRAFLENRADADAKYLGRRITVYGSISDLSRSGDDTYLNIGKGLGGWMGVWASFPISQEPLVSKLNPGDGLVLTGTVKTVHTQPGPIPMLEIVDCEITPASQITSLPSFEEVSFDSLATPEPPLPIISRCHTALKSRIGDLMFSMLVLDLNTKSLYLNRGLM